MFREVPARPDYVKLENEVLRLWAETRAFEQLRAQTRGGPKWSFLDGPITANNPMGVHHAWGRTYKDLYNRYHAMLGQELRWQQGFDCQGLWVEVAVEKDLGFTSKRQIEEYGVAEFVEQCKQRVYHYADVISRQSQRLGYWMDWDNSYFTLSDENNYSIWGFLKLCHERGWLYRGQDVMPWCPRCGTALSEHEIATEGYAEKTHLALTAAFALLDRPGEALLVWTTTPWTLAANVAAAVHPELTYVRVEQRTKNKEQNAENREPRTENRELRTDHRPPTTDDGALYGGPSVAAQSFWLVKEAFERLKLTPSPAHPFTRSAWEVVEERPGADLVGWRYHSPFDALPAQQGVEHRAVPWSEVSEAEGTGVVHIAPGAGKEDFALGQEHGLAVLAPLDDNGVYVAGYGWLSGRAAGTVAEDVAAELERKGLLFDREMYTHRYPVCWRCGTELVFRLTDEWLISMDELRHPMMDAAREANWLPPFGLERELDWLRNMDDWMISKKRYWGLALPLYPCDACGQVTVVGSREELHKRAVAGWEQFEGHSPHRPWVDAVKIACEHCGAPVARVPDVGNVWLDAGIVAFSTLGYRHDRTAWQQWFPADLVLESFPGQFRNWFYALLAMSTAIEGRAPFKTLLGHALVKDEHGEEMHKSKGNAIWFEDAAAWMGVEPLRWLFASVPLDRNVNFGRSLVAETARRLQALWEVYRFFVTYANLEKRLETGDWRLERRQSLISHLQSPLDQWLLARLNQLVAVACERLEAYDARGFALAVEVFLDDLSNWYVRRSRRRFWGTAASADDADKQAAYTVLYTTLVTLTRLLAPVLPFLSEALYQNLVRSVDPDAPVSVHLTGYPQEIRDWRLEIDETRQSLISHLQSQLLLQEMDMVRRVVGLGRVARKAAGLRVRQPLARILVAGANAEERAGLLRHQEHVLDELNIKALELLDGDTPAGQPQGVSLQQYRVKPNLRLLGPRLGKALPALRAALDALDEPAAAAVARAIEAGQSVTLALGDNALVLAPAELLVESAPLAGYAVAQEGSLQVALDTALDDALRREGLARDLVRAVQETRKAAGLGFADRITLYLAGNDELDRVLDVWDEYVRSETLAETLVVGQLPSDVYAETAALDGATVAVGVARREIRD
jgi:isoleucyl-tRNA synthetase